jgi:hypothetical protein
MEVGYPSAEELWDDINYWAKLLMVPYRFRLSGTVDRLSGWRRFAMFIPRS